MAPTTVRVRRTQAERRSTTRALLLDATIDALFELGYSATTTTVIAERAGVSRGAQQNHYRTKAELVAAAVEHLANKLIAEVEAGFVEASGVDPLDYAIDVLWSTLSSPLLAAWIELSVASRTDAELRATLQPVEARLQGEIAATVHRAVGDGIEYPQALLILTMSLCLFEGIALERANALKGSPFGDIVPLMVDTWKAMIRTMFPTPNAP